MKDGMNDLYVNDRMDRDTVDFDGSGKGSGHYTRNSEFVSNLKSASLFILLDVIFAIMFLVVVFMVCKDCYTRANGNYVTMENAVVTDKAIKAKYDGIDYSFDPGPSVVVNSDNSIKVYYTGTSYYNGSILMSTNEYLIGFGLTILLMLFCSWRIYKTVHVTNHSQGAVYKGRFDD